MSCENARNLTLAAPATALTGSVASTFERAAFGLAGLPPLPHCRVDGIIDERTGSDGRPYAIGFAVNLPDRWNGRLLFQGGGGLNGAVNEPLGNAAAGASSALRRGFAVVSTDSGHQGSVAGAPAARTAYSNLGLRWAQFAFNEIVARDAQGRPVAAALSQGERERIVAGVVQQCDALDGLADGMIFATQQCDFDPASLVCPELGSQCLSSAQAGAVKKALSGPRTSGGQQVYPGYLYDTGIATTTGLSGILVGPPIPEGPQGPVLTLDVDAEVYAAANSISSFGDSHAWTNLGTFAGRGGKLILFHGVSDPWFSALESVRYYESLAPANGGADAVANFSRLFLVPGMGHCNGGAAALDQFDFVSALVAWVERNEAPERVVATGAAFPNRSRPLCPYPAYAHYTSGDAENAASFECRRPQ